MTGEAIQNAQPAQHASEYRVHFDDLPPEVHEIPAEPLGPYGDIPAAYAVFKIQLSETSDKVIRTFYLYASPEYCRLANVQLEDIVGASHLEVVKIEFEHWLTYAYRAAMHGESFNGVEYSALTQSWVSYSIAPSQVEGCFTLAFVPISNEERERQLSVDARTTQVISELLGALAGERSYETAMAGMLEKTAELLRPDHIVVFEYDGIEVRGAFSRSAEGLEPLLDTTGKIPSKAMETWFKTSSKDPVALVPNTLVLARFSPPLYEWCVANGLNNIMSAPFINEGEIVGMMCAYNYQIDESIDLNRVFASVSSFIGARIDNHRLIESLEWAGTHDAMTKLLNRYGSNIAFEKALDENPDGPLVMIMVDLDDLKLINDQFGHDMGDEALKALARYLVETFPETAILCRTGGDEFIVGLVGPDVARADELIRDFAALDMEYTYDGVPHSVTASIGYACIPDQAASLREVKIKADKALYAVKKTGKSSVMKYTPDMG